MTLFIRADGDGPFPPEAVDWKAAKALWLHDHGDERAGSAAFILAAHMRQEHGEDIYIELLHTNDAIAARQYAARISTQHDVPLDDWTRPRRPLLSADAFALAVVRATLGVGENEYVPDRKAGTIADACFLGACDDMEFRDVLEGATARAIAAASTEGDHDPDDVAEAGLHFMWHERNRWSALNAANVKPPRPPGLESALQ